MKQYAKFYQLKNQAKDALGGKYGTAIWVVLLGTLIPGAIRMFANLLLSPFMPSAAGASNPGVQIPAFLFSAVVSLLLSILLGVFDAGIAYCFLKLACGQSCRIGDLFFGFQEDFKKFVTLSGTLAILNALCLFPYQYLLEEYLYTRNSQWLYLALGAMAIGFCIYIPLELSLSMSYFLALDFPEKSAGDILRQGMRLMKGQKKRLFLMELSFLPLMLLCVLTIYVGFIWLIPYLYMTKVQFYLNLMQPETM